MKLFIGCCGLRKSLEDYSKEFETLEIQKTFYNLPKEKTLESWKKKVPANFVFSVKAFQGITHPFSSPTWKRFRGEIPGNPENLGFLKPSKEVFWAWKETEKICNCLGARFCLIQLPKSFNDSRENFENAEKFFKKIDPKKLGFKIAIELRGWSLSNIKKLGSSYNLIDCCDPFVRNPFLGRERIAYLRLHGSPPGKKLYSYKYSDKDFEILREKLLSFKAKEIYLYFNNIFMFEDALRFKKYVEKEGL